MARAKLSRLLFEAGATAAVLEPLVPGVIPIEEARLCLDCEVICQGGLCPQCAGRSLHPISAWLKSVPQPVLRLERRRAATDRRKRQDPNYTGPERRKSGDRRADARR